MLRKADGTVIQFEAAETLWKSPLSGATSPVAAAALEVVHNAAPASALSLAPPVLELHQPAVQQCLLYDANVRRAAASCAEVDVLGGQRQRSWSFSRGWNFPPGYTGQSPQPRPKTARKSVVSRLRSAVRSVTQLRQWASPRPTARRASFANRKALPADPGLAQPAAVL